MTFFPVDRDKPSTQSRQAKVFGSGENIYRGGGEGLAWRLRNGVVRLDTLAADRQIQFASLAVAGDILGCETLLFGTYTFTATALTHCEISPWPEGEGAVAGESLLTSLANAQKRAAQVVGLRGGQAADRVLSLIRLLADGAGQVILPSRQDIADITDLRFETISRVIKILERSQVLAPTRIDGVHATRGYQVSWPTPA